MKNAAKFRERVSVICLHNEQILGFEAADPQSQQTYFFIPGGGIEPGESNLQAAARETWEETGYRVRVLSETLLSARYPFHWDGKDFDCLTHFYLGRLLGPWHPPGLVMDQAYNKGPCWRDIKNISQDFAYSADIRDAILKIVVKSQNLP